MRKLVQNELETLDNVLLCEFHFSHIESLNTLDLETIPLDSHADVLTRVGQQWAFSSESSRG